MILSFHPVFVGDQNILCAGRDPGEEERTAIWQAQAVILPQGCRESLYSMASQGPAPVFPDYQARFRYPGKLGQASLFKKASIPHPETLIFPTLKTFRELSIKQNPPFDFPWVFKFDWGGEGHTVYLLKAWQDLDQAVEKAALFEETGQCGFVIQKFIPCGQRCLRAVVLHEKIILYWKISAIESPVMTGMRQGASIDHQVDADVKKQAIAATRNLCKKTGINLAGLDLIFPENNTGPLFLEINHYFGRRGLGGSDNYYRLLTHAINDWLKSPGLIREAK